MKLIVAQLVKKFSAFMELEVSLLFLQEPISCIGIARWFSKELLSSKPQVTGPPLIGRLPPIILHERVPFLTSTSENAPCYDNIGYV
jgi:hypothetical protein